MAQSVFTPLINDEPYYWLYAQYPSWGYFDHPPMIAFLIKIGTSILPTEIGVRLLSSALGSFTFLLIYKLIEGEASKPVNVKLAALLLFSSLFLNMYSFMAIPDTPLLFFGALFLYCYRKYLNNDSLLNAVLLGIVTALLLYSKYHGILLVGFTLLSNIRLLIKRSFYAVFVVALILFVPHLYWQFQNDYPTIRFQLLQKAGAFDVGHVFSYLGEQAAATGPVILLLFSILFKPQNQFQKALKYNVCGIFVFFLISSFKEMVNVHWTAIAWPGMLCMAYLYINDLKTNKKLITGVLVFNLVLVIILRINFIGNFFQIPNFNDKNPKLMTAELEKRSKGHPLVFMDVYNDPAYVIFYGHQNSFAVNNIWYKETQFNYLPALENAFQGKTVSLVSNNPVNKSSEEVSIKKGKKYYITVLPNFASFTGLKVKAASFTDCTASTESSVKFSIENKLSDTQKALFKQKEAYLMLTFINNVTKQSFSYRYDRQLDINSTEPLDFTFKAPAIRGTYSCIFSVTTHDAFGLGFNSNIYTCRVK
jgi:hypothetical protein